MEYRTKLSLLIVIFIPLCIILSIKRRESFDGGMYKHPPGSDSQQRKRERVDNILKRHASTTLGTEETPIYLINNFLSPEECSRIIESMQGKLEKSPLTRQDPNDPLFRTSETGYFTNSPFHLSLEKKLCNLLEIPETYTESSQVQHYKRRNEFKLHYDWFDHIHDKNYWMNGQRTWTAMIYLNDVEDGGHTKFPKVGADLKPIKGQLVVWSNLDQSGRPDYNTLHQGSPVKDGEKWIVTKWFLDKKG